MRGRARVAMSGGRVVECEYVADEREQDGLLYWDAEIYSVYFGGRNVTAATQVQLELDDMEARLADELRVYGRATR